MTKKDQGTSGGVVLTDELIERLTQDAEGGYDVDQLVRKGRRGRPPLGSHAATTFQVRLDPELREALDSRADSEETTASDITRQALRRYLDLPSAYTTRIRNAARLSAALEGLGRFGGPEALRAAEMLLSALYTCVKADVRWSEHTAFAVRECLEAIPKLFGVPERRHDLRGPLARALEALRRHATDPNPKTELLSSLAEDIDEALRTAENVRRDRVALAMANQAGKADYDSRELASFATRWSRTVERANNILHGEDHDPQEAIWLVDTAIDLVASLTARISARLDELDTLAPIEEPTTEDLERVLSLLADPRLARYFYARASSGWLVPLDERGIFSPPIQGDWYQSDLLTRASSVHRERVLQIASRFTKDAHPAAAPTLLAVARAIGPEGCGLAVGVLAQSSYPSRWLVANELERLAEAYAARGSPTGLPRLADAAFVVVKGEGDDRSIQTKFEAYDFADLIVKFVILAPPDDLQELTRILGYKLRHALEILDESRRGILTMFLSSVAEPVERVPKREFAAHALLSGVRVALERLRDCGTSITERKVLINWSDSELLTRQWAHHLAEDPAESRAESLDLLASMLSTRSPSPEAMRLLQTTWPVLSEVEQHSLLERLGEPTDPATAARWEEEDELHRRLLRQWRWLAGLSGHLPSHWQEAYDALVEQFGEGDPSAGRRGIEMYWGTPSPLQATEIRDMGPASFSAWAGSWRPPEGGWRNPTPAGLAIQLREAVAGAPLEWASALPELARELQHPTYVRGVLEGLLDAVRHGTSNLAWRNLVRAAQFVSTSLWPVEPLGAAADEEDQDWRFCADAAVDLLEAALDRDVADIGPFLEQIWSVLAAVLTEYRDSHTVVREDALTQAINTTSTRALDCMFNFVAYVSRSGGDVAPWAARLLAVIDEELNTGPTEQRLASAIVARRFNQFLFFLPEAAIARTSQLFGDPADEDWDVSVFDDLLLYCRPSGEVLRLAEPYLRRYLRTERDESEGRESARSAIEWIVLGYVWGVEGYAPGVDVLGRFSGDVQLSQAAEFYGRVLTNSGEIPHEVSARALGFWDSLLSRVELSPAALAGFGWWAGAQLRDEDWLPRMVEVLRRTRGRIDWEHEVVKRLVTLYELAEAWEGLALLVRGAENPWDVGYWSEPLHALLAVTGLPEDIRSLCVDLIDALLERELLEFRRYLSPVDQDAGHT